MTAAASSAEKICRPIPGGQPGFAEGPDSLPGREGEPSLETQHRGQGHARPGRHRALLPQ